MKMKIGFLLIILAVLSQSSCEILLNEFLSNGDESSNSALRSFMTSPGDIDPPFSSSETQYTLIVGAETDSVDVTYSTEDSGAEILVNGAGSYGSEDTFNLNTSEDGDTIAIEVIAVDGSSTTYLFTIEKTVEPTALLNDLVFSTGDLSPAFTPDIMEYSLIIENGEVKLFFTPESEDEEAVINVRTPDETISGHPSGSATREFDIEEGESTFYIEVISSVDSNVFQSYRIDITRDGPLYIPKLGHLSLSTGVLSPSFDADTTEYTTHLDYYVTELSITAEADNPGGDVTVNQESAVGGLFGPYSVSSDQDSTYIIRVVDPEDTAIYIEYVITVSVGIPPAPTLNEISIPSVYGILTPAFDPGITTYTSTVAFDVPAVQVTANAGDATHISVNSNDFGNYYQQAFDLSEGANVLVLDAVSDFGLATVSYSLTVTREAEVHIYSADLSTLAFYGSSLNPVFSSEVTTYAATVSTSTASVTLHPVPVDDEATVTIDGVDFNYGSQNHYEQSLDYGENVIDIEVAAGDGSATRTYTLTVTRALSSEARLIELTVVGEQGEYNISFGWNDVLYDLPGLIESELSITPTAYDNLASSITVNDASVTSGDSISVDLAFGNNVIDVVCVAQDGESQQTYTINAERHHWTKQFGSSATFERGEDIVVSDTGDVIVIGSDQGYPSFADEDSFIHIEHQDGTSDAYDIDKGNAVAMTLDSSGNVFYAGGENFYGPFGDDVDNIPNAYVMKTQIDGQPLLYNPYGQNDDFAEFATGVAVTDNHIYLSGSRYTISSPSQFSPPLDSEAFIAQLPIAGGAAIAAVTIGADVFNFGMALAQDSDGNLFIAGEVHEGEILLDEQSFIGEKDIYISKYDESLQHQWTRVIGSTVNDYFGDLVADSAGNVYFTGSADDSVNGESHSGSGASNILTVKLDTSGNTLWTRLFGGAGHNQGFGIALGDNDSVYVVGRSSGTDHPDDVVPGVHEYAAILKYTNTGTLVWSHLKGAGTYTHAYAAAYDGSEFIYVTGSTEGNLDEQQNMDEGNDDIFILKYDTAGVQY